MWQTQPGRHNVHSQKASQGAPSVRQHQGTKDLCQQMPAGTGEKTAHSRRQQTRAKRQPTAALSVAHGPKLCQGDKACRQDYLPAQSQQCLLRYVCTAMYGCLVSHVRCRFAPRHVRPQPYNGLSRQYTQPCNRLRNRRAPKTSVFLPHQLSILSACSNADIKLKPSPVSARKHCS